MRHGFLKEPMPECISEAAELAARLSIDLGALRAPDRRAPIVDKRARVARKLAKMGFSFTAIGRALDRDRTTIDHLVLHRKRSSL